MSEDEDQTEDYTFFTLSAQHNSQTGSFSELSKAFKDDPSLEHYLQLRRDNPGQLIEIATSWSMEWCFEHQERVEALGIDIMDVVGSLDADEASASRLSLKLIELIVERRRRELAGETQIVGRGDAISDSLVNYLIAMMLDALDWNDEMVISRDLVVLIKHQLGADRSFEAQQMQVRENRKRAVWIAAQSQVDGRSLSMRGIAKALGVNATTVMRWFSDSSFEAEVAEVAKLIDSDEFREIQNLGKEVRDKNRTEM